MFITTNAEVTFRTAQRQSGEVSTGPFVAISSKTFAIALGMGLVYITVESGGWVIRVKSSTGEDVGDLCVVLSCKHLLREKNIFF